MQPPTLPDPIWVDRPAVFTRMLEDLSGQPVLAVDTESNSLYVYREQVCLIQFSTLETDYLVDPLALKDLSALAEIFSNPEIEKVFHAATYDLICLKRDYGFSFVNLFDTMQAARILGRPACGLGSLIEEEFNITLDKRYQRANWGERPLKREMLAYARLDTHYLFDLRERLKDELIQAERWDLAQEDFNQLCNVAAGPSEPPCCNWWHVAGGTDLDRRQADLLYQLCEYREQAARAANLPPFKVMPNSALLAVALACPKNESDLNRVNGLPERIRWRHMNGFLQAIERAQQIHAPRRPFSPRPSQSYLDRLDGLRGWRKETSQKWKVESDIILPKDALEAIAASGPKQLDELKVIMAAYPWRFEHFGSQILQAIAEEEHT